MSEDTDAVDMLTVFKGLTDGERLDEAKRAVRSLAKVLEQIDAEEIESSDLDRAYLAGVVAALSAVTAHR